MRLAPISPSGWPSASSSHAVQFGERGVLHHHAQVVRRPARSVRAPCPAPPPRARWRGATRVRRRSGAPAGASRRYVTAPSSTSCASIAPQRSSSALLRARFGVGDALREQPAFLGHDLFGGERGSDSASPAPRRPRHLLRAVEDAIDFAQPLVDVRAQRADADLLRRVVDGQLPAACPAPAAMRARLSAMRPRSIGASTWAAIASAAASMLRTS